VRAYELKELSVKKNHSIYSTVFVFSSNDGRELNLELHVIIIVRVRPKPSTAEITAATAAAATAVAASNDATNKDYSLCNKQ